MKKISLISLIVIGFLLNGCSSKNTELKKSPCACIKISNDLGVS